MVNKITTAITPMGVTDKINELIDSVSVEQTFDGTSTLAQSGASILGLLEAIYPIGAVYIGTTSTCPMSSLFGTWTLVSSGKALWTGDGTNANTTIAAGLPQLTGGIHICSDWGKRGTPWGVFAGSAKAGDRHGEGLSSGMTLSYAASNSNSIYGNSSTVQPPAYVVNVWRRTA